MDGWMDERLQADCLTQVKSVRVRPWIPATYFFTCYTTGLALYAPTHAVVISSSLVPPRSSLPPSPPLSHLRIANLIPRSLLLQRIVVVLPSATLLAPHSRRLHFAVCLHQTKPNQTSSYCIALHCIVLHFAVACRNTATMLFAMFFAFWRIMQILTLVRLFISSNSVSSMRLCASHRITLHTVFQRHGTVSRKLPVAVASFPVTPHPPPPTSYTHLKMPYCPSTQSKMPLS